MGEWMIRDLLDCWHMFAILLISSVFMVGLSQFHLNKPQRILGPRSPSKITITQRSK